MPLAINQLIEDVKLLNEAELIELNQFIVGRIKHERNEASRRMKRQLFVGTKVSFEDNDGWTTHGKIVKVMRKFAQVDTGANIWRVPLNRLTKLEAA
tara:strand:+ start:1270 stop:1560 length:291 start_codon:yes stop_codon:yes gene_type:complete